MHSNFPQNKRKLVDCDEEAIHSVCRLADIYFYYKLTWNYCRSYQNLLGALVKSMAALLFAANRLGVADSERPLPPNVPDLITSASPTHILILDRRTQMPKMLFRHCRSSQRPMAFLQRNQPPLLRCRTLMPSWALLFPRSLLTTHPLPKT